MAKDLLIGVGASITGNWVRVEPPGHKTWPFRVMFTADVSGSPWTAGNVILEELIGALPISPGPITQYNPGQLTAGSQTGNAGNILTLGTFPAGSGDFEIDSPVEFIRARTDANIVGKVSIRLLEAD